MDFDKEYEALYEPVMKFRDRYDMITKYMCQYVNSITHSHGISCFRTSLPSHLAFVDFNKGNPSQKEFVERYVEDIKKVLDKDYDLLLHFEIQRNRRRIIEILMEKFNLKLEKFLDYRHIDFYFSIKHEAFDELYTVLKLTGEI